ncbi:MAG: DUF554 domain-containing protein [Clostridium sp.]|uniref:DUF554 domain-containing protein n=1 Tax=Clostridium sp. TaxID=1506 RepID=UPI0039E7FA2F
MPIGVIINALSVLFGGLIGAFLGDKIPERVRKALPLTFGAASMAMGISLIVKMNTMPAVILSLILGSAIGELIKLEKGIEWCAGRVRKPVEKIFSSKGNIHNQKEFMEKFVGIVVLFCASGTGIFGALNEGMTGDHSVLIAKSFLDFFTAGIFATALGYIVLTICVPQFILLICLFFSASFILPMTTPTMVADFTACGGIIMLATGFRISGIKAFPIANMLPALVLVMPISHLWTMFVK